LTCWCESECMFQRPLMPFLSDANTVLMAIAITAVIYVLCHVADDWVNEELGLPPETKASVTAILLFLLWYAVHCTRNLWRMVQSSGRTTVALPELFTLLVALII